MGNELKTNNCCYRSDAMNKNKNGGQLPRDPEKSRFKLRFEEFESTIKDTSNSKYESSMRTW